MPSNLPPGFEYEDAPQSSSLPPGFEYEKDPNAGGAAPDPNDPLQFKTGPAGISISNKESAPGQMTPDELQANMSPSARSQYVNDDIAKSALTGTRKFFTGALGLPGMVEEYAGKGVEALADAAGSRYKYPRMLPNPEEVEAGVGKIMPLGWAPYLSHKPQTTQGQIAETGMEVLPGFVTGSSANLARRAALARAPSQAELATETVRRYDILNQAGLTYDTSRYGRMLNRVDTEIGHPAIGDNARSLWNRMHTNLQRGRMGNPVEFDAMEGMYQEAGQVLRNRASSDADRRVATVIQRHLDDFRGDNANLLTGNMSAPQAREAVRSAREIASRNIKTKHWEEVERTASELTDPGEYSNYVRRQVNNILTNPNLRRTYSRVELDALKRARSSGPVERSAQGGPFISGLRSMAAGTVGQMAGGPLGAMAGAGGAGVAAHVIKAGSEVARRSRLDEAIAIMRAGRGAHIPRRAGVAERAALGASGLPAVATETAPAMAMTYGPDGQPTFVPSPTGGLMRYLPTDDDQQPYGSTMGIRG